ncbi:MAG: sulfotransferase domain-containing protein [Campylobacterales bacterium]|nr:sulfotransferase domain-containing protein [Campylobacterales bacterium]
MNKVNFLIIGVQKGGTTALDSYLRKHPQISMAKQKEVHYFDNESNFENSPDYDKYHQYFEENDKLKGETTPIYIYWNNAIERIWEYNKNIIIIVILRNPIERAYSHWNMELSRNAEKMDFYDAIIHEGERTKEALPYKHRVYSYVDRGFYSEQLRNLYRYFDKSQVLVIKNEHLKQYPLETLNQVCAFLKVDKFKSIEAQSIHAREYTAPMDAKSFEYLRHQFEYDIKECERITEQDCSNWMKDNDAKSVWFYRDFRNYTGGHQKVFDYFCHFREHLKYKVDIAFSDETKWDESNPWYGLYKNFIHYDCRHYDILFVAGMDWEMVPSGAEENKVVINLIQGLRHSNPEHKLYEFLERKAIRICVSKEVEMALRNTGKVNGEIYTIKNGHTLPELKKEKVNDFYILGLKNPAMAEKIRKRLSKMNFKVIISIKQIPRDKVFENMATSRISILLPNYNESEGFYLPALEAMKYSDLTIVPDCVGNRGFCKDNENCLMPSYNEEDIMKKALEGIKILNDTAQKENFKQKVQQTVMKHSIESERSQFYKILEEIMDA